MTLRGYLTAFTFFSYYIYRGRCLKDKAPCFGT